MLLPTLSRSLACGARMITADPGLNPLLTAAAPTLYAHNAFRLTGLPVTASMREVARYGDKLKLLLQVGGQAAAGLPAMLGCTHVPGPDELRDALRNLMDPRTRMLHEFFWFWPDKWAEPEGDTAFQLLRQMDLDTARAMWSAREEGGSGSCVAIHNLAVLSLMRALDLGLRDLESPLQAQERDEMHAEWRMAKKRWGRLAMEDDLWDIYRARIIQMDDPSVTTGMARRLHEDLLWALDRILAMLAVAFAERKRRIECQWYTAFLKSYLGGDAAAFHKATDHALTHVRERLDQALQAAKRQTQVEEMEGIAKARVLLDTSAPLLKVVEMVEARQGGRDSENIGRGALDIAVDGYRKIYCSNDTSPAVLARRGERRHAEEYLCVMERSRALTTDASVHRIIDSNIRIAKDLLRTMPPELDFALPKPFNDRGKVVLDPGQRPKWGAFFLHCLRIMPRSVWVVIVVYSLSICASWMVSAISSRPVESGRFTRQEMAALGLPQRVGTQALWDIPQTGVFQRSPPLQTDDIRLQISAPANENGIHFCATLALPGTPKASLKVFIRNGETASFSLPSNIYELTLNWGSHWSILEDRFQPQHERKILPSVHLIATHTVLQITPLSNDEFSMVPTR